MARARYLIVPLLLSSLAASAPEEVVYAPQALLGTPGISTRDTNSFGELRNQVIELIGSSRKRVWLMTDYLTDGDIVSALYLAKYRKIDVRVFLGQEHQNDYLSRLNYLRTQNIPVFVRPEQAYQSPSLIFVDQRLFTISRDLNVLSRQNKASIAQASPAHVKAFVTWFREIAEFLGPSQIQQDAQGKLTYPSKSKKIWKEEPINQTPNPYREGGGDNDTYNYDRAKTPRRAPEGVPTLLPKTPRWKKIQDMRLQGEADSKTSRPLPNPAPISATGSALSPENIPDTGPNGTNPGIMENVNGTQK